MSKITGNKYVENVKNKSNFTIDNKKRTEL